MKYLLEYNHRAAFVEMQRGDSSDYYGAVQRAFQHQAGGDGDRFAFVSMTRMDDIETVCGVPITWSLAGPNGAAFELLALPGITAAQIQCAKAELRLTRDVVSLRVRRIESLFDFTPPARQQAMAKAIV